MVLLMGDDDVVVVWWFGGNALFQGWLRLLYTYNKEEASFCAEQSESRETPSHTRLNVG